MNELRQTFVNQHRRKRSEGLLRTRTIGPDESITSFVEDVLRLSARADPQAPGEKLRVLMRSVKDDIFRCLVRNAPTTVEAFIVEATNMERALRAKASHYQRHPGLTAHTPSSIDLNASIAGIREVIRDIVREELKKLLAAPDCSISLSIFEVVRDDV